MAFGVVKELLKPSENLILTVVMNVCCILLFVWLACTMASTGSKLTAEADMTGIIVSKMLIEISEEDKRRRNDFVYFMTQIKARNVNVQNFMFRINWNVVLAVSEFMRSFYMN